MTSREKLKHFFFFFSLKEKRLEGEKLKADKRKRELKTLI
jgi:hypothetical protein